MQDPNDITEGIPCPVCAHTLKGWPEPNPTLALAVDALEKLQTLVARMQVEDEASFAYAFKLAGLKRERTDGADYEAYWPESQDEDYFTITSLAEKIGDAMTAISRAGRAVEVAIHVDNEGQYPPHTLRFPYGVDKEEAVRMLHPAERGVGGELG